MAHYLVTEGVIFAIGFAFGFNVLSYLLQIFKLDFWTA